MDPKTCPPSPSIVSEYPPNPNLLNFHMRQELTVEMSERFDANSSPDVLSMTYPWVADILSLKDIHKISLMRHHVRFRKSKDADWSDLFPEIKRIFLQYRNPIDFVQLEKRKDMYRDFPVNPSCPASGRLVFEGTLEAEAHPLAKKLFSFHGLTVVVCAHDKLSLKRSCAFSWEELLPRIKKMIT